MLSFFLFCGITESICQEFIMIFQEFIRVITGEIMDKKTSLRYLNALFLISVLIFSLGDVSAVEWDVNPNGSGDFTSIQEAINDVSVKNGDVIKVHKGTYAENVLVNKKLTIKTNQNDVVNIKSSKTAFTIMKDLTGDGSGSIIKGFKITNNPNGLGFNITVHNCKIENNVINGGKTGIFTVGNNTIIRGNRISGVLNNSIQVGYSTVIDATKTILMDAPVNCRIENNNINGGLTGIAVLGDTIIITRNEISNVISRGIAVFGCYPTISANIIKDMVSGGSKIGISLASINLTGSTGLTITGNKLFNIKSTNETVMGIDAFAMSMNSTLDDILILENTISNLYGFGKSTAISIVGLALNGPLSTIKVIKNTITNITSRGVNSTSTAISFVAMGFKNNTKTYNNTTTVNNLAISKNKITGLKSEDENGASKGISFVQLCKGKAFISENNISNFKADLMAVGITSAGVDYTNFQSNVTINKNKITDLTANTVTSGIQSVNLGNTNILHNNIFRLNSGKTKYMVVQTPLIGTATIKGNNLEGNGAGEGIAVKGKSTTINYNRIVNFKHFIQNINTTEAFEFSQGRSLLTDKELRNYLISQYGTNITEDNITAIINAYHKLRATMEAMEPPSHTNAPYNWYGTNRDPGIDKFLLGKGTINYKPWLVLSINAKPSTINVGQTSKITANVYTDSAGGDHSANAGEFFNGPQITFTTNLGNVGSKSVVAEWVNGLATAILRADEGAGVATVTSSDYQPVWTYVTILGAPSNTLNAATKTVGMQRTGTPINYLILAFLVVLGGFILSRRE